MFRKHQQLGSIRGHPHRHRGNHEHHEAVVLWIFRRFQKMCQRPRQRGYIKKAVCIYPREWRKFLHKCSLLPGNGFKADQHGKGRSGKWLLPEWRHWANHAVWTQVHLQRNRCLALDSLQTRREASRNFCLTQQPMTKISYFSFVYQLMKNSEYRSLAN